MLRTYSFSGVLVGMLILFTIVWAHGLFAANSEPVRATLSLYQVTRNAAGQIKLTAADHLKPGDLAEYQLTYTNTSGAAVRHLRATLPIPEGMSYQADTAKPANAQASLDGKSFAAMPLTRTVKVNGKATVVIIPCSEYRDLRWTINELAAGQSVTLVAQVTIQGNSAIPTTPVK